MLLHALQIDTIELGWYGKKNEATTSHKYGLLTAASWVQAEALAVAVPVPVFIHFGK